MLTLLRRSNFRIPANVLRIYDHFRNVLLKFRFCVCARFKSVAFRTNVDERWSEIHGMLLIVVLSYTNLSRILKI